jgi:hypothetical protein
MEQAMKTQISYTALGLALAMGVPAVAHAQTVVTQTAMPTETVVTQPVQTVRTVETVRTERPLSRHVITRRVVTTRTTVHERVIAAPSAAVVAAPAPAVAATYSGRLYDQASGPLYDQVSGPLYDQVGPASTYSTYPRYSQPTLYDAVVPAPVPAFPATVVGTTVVSPTLVSPAATEIPTYRYVYQPDRILVIDPTTGVAVQSIPR